MDTFAALGLDLRAGSLVFMESIARDKSSSAMKPFVLDTDKSIMVQAVRKLQVYLTPQAKPAESFKRWLNMMGQMTPPNDPPLNVWINGLSYKLLYKAYLRRHSPSLSDVCAESSERVWIEQGWKLCPSQVPSRHLAKGMSGSSDVVWSERAWIPLIRVSD